MDYGVVTKLLGRLLIFQAGALLLPLFVSAYYREMDVVLAFIYVIVLLVTIGGIMEKGAKGKRQIGIKEGLVIVTGGWVLTSFFGSLPFVFSGSLPSLIDAFFETVSGLTTTGSTLIDNIEALPRGILFWRSFTHWIGGMGILVLTLAILPAIGVGGLQIFKAESPGPISDKMVPRIRDTATILYTSYFGLTLLLIILLLLGKLSLYDAAVHTFGAVGTGGLSIYQDSIGAYSSNYVIFTIGIFMVASGVNFSLYYELFKGNWREFVQDSELKLYLFIIGASLILITLNLYGKDIYGSLFETFKHAFFQISSIITTTGYITTDYEKWTSFSKGILFLLMFVGGCGGSTAGSIKVIRILILLKLVKREVLKILHPRAVIPIRVNCKVVSPDLVTGISSFFFLYLLFQVMGTLLISLEGIDLTSAASAVAATLGNIGPGFGVVGPTQTFSSFSGASKLFFSFLMLFGRLELYTVFILLLPNFWYERI